MTRLHAVHLVGELDAARLNGLRAALGMQRRGRLTDLEDADFGYRVITVGAEQAATLRLWRDDEQPGDGGPRWRIVVEADGPTGLTDGELAAWVERIEAAAVAAGLTVVESRPGPIGPRPTRALFVLVRRELSPADQDRLRGELGLDGRGDPADRHGWNFGERRLTPSGQPAVVMRLLRLQVGTWAVAVDADPAAVVDPADLARWTAMVSSATGPASTRVDERRRQNLAIARWRREWLDRHGLDEVEHLPAGAEVDPAVRWPTAEQEREFIHGVRRILGQDPETGRYLDEQ
jgi:hypothetical protein